MKCSEKQILNAKGLLLVNCDKPNNSFAGVAIPTDDIAAINDKIADGTLRFIRWESNDAISNNSEDATEATDGHDTVQVNSPRIGININLNSHAGTLIKAAALEGAVQGYIVLRDGSLVGKPTADQATLQPIDIDVTMPSPLPNTVSVNGSNLPVVAIRVNFGPVENLLAWRWRHIVGADNVEDYLELEIADPKVLSSTTVILTDFLGNELTSLADISDADFSYSQTYTGTPAISSGVITFAAIPAGTTVTVNGSISGYLVSQSFTMS